ncbi:carbon monoxide dehydrogenase, partial [Jiangella rhizosphaerae]
AGEAAPAPAPEAPEVPTAAAPEAAVQPPAATTPSAAEPEPLDVMGVAGGSIIRRAVPLVLVLVVLVGVVIYLATR